MYFDSIVKGIPEHSLPGSSLAEKLTRAAELGFSFMELDIGEDNDSIRRLEWDADALQQLYAQRLANNICISSLHLQALRRYPLGHSDPKRRMLGMDLVRRALMFCVKAGIPILRLPECITAGEPTEESNTSWYLQNFCICAQSASRYQVTLGCPISGDQAFFTRDRFEKLSDACASRWIAASPDLGHLFASAGSRTEINETLMAIYRSLCLVTLSDRDSDGRPDFPGNGVSDLRRMFECLQALGYAGAVLLDLPEGSDAGKIQSSLACLAKKSEEAECPAGVPSDANPLSQPFIRIQR